MFYSAFYDNKIIITRSSYEMQNINFVHNDDGCEIASSLER